MQNKISGEFIQVSYSEREVLSSSRVFMKLFKALFFFLLLGGDYGLELASLEAFPTQVLGCDGRANILFAPTCPFLLCRPRFIGGTALLTVIAFLSLLLIISWTDLGRPIPIILFGMWSRR